MDGDPADQLEEHLALELGLWRVDGDPVRLAHSNIPLEKKLEDLIEQDPDILGAPLLIIGRQVPTAYGKFLDLLAVDGDGALHAIELKRDRTPRDVTAQVLDYGSWVQQLTHEDVIQIFATYRVGISFEQAFADRFEVAPPEAVNTGHVLTIVAADMDPATERIINYLAGFRVPINVALFRHFTDGERSYLARTWLLSEVASPEAGTNRQGTKEPWNGQDWYVSFGEEAGIRSWKDARTYGFVSAGGGEWYSRSLRTLPVGARIFVYIPRRGYVGVGTVTGEAQPFETVALQVGDATVRMAGLDLGAGYRHAVDGPGREEFVVPVTWEHTLDQADAFWQKGMFANQNSACKLRNRFTLDLLTERFGLDD
ncbi:hypothetical protein QEZ54_34395 [Catellatospora sp. KI3]|uniref:hypothetical protein n=1 Tax=Catellatospora sp. KI3 TaxID=3041620 RepID=UPI0024823748|nr:hypothetical protein [Catellatospora sp. KI3]MDI1466078.1 hypothetical protein [Catellatospora sp. KI3]